MMWWRTALALLLLVACSEQNPAPVKYGAPLTLKTETGIAMILAQPEAYLGQRVLVQGKVLDVCAKAGCWLELAGEEAGQQIKVKVNDGEIVFPMSARGQTARVEGEVYKIELTADQAHGYLAHLAEEKGEPFDSTQVTGPLTIYQIKGLGAEIAAK